MSIKQPFYGLSHCTHRLVESNHWGSKGSIVSKFYEGMPDRRTRKMDCQLVNLQSVAGLEEDLNQLACQHRVYDPLKQ